MENSSDLSKYNLSVTGSTLLLTPKFKIPLKTRKIYNSSFFHDETFRHEIANHYRDMKLRPRIRRHRRNVVLVRHRKKSPVAHWPIGNDPYEFRDELPIKKHDFPRFTQVYSPNRGRRNLCANEPPDDTYNDTIRRIHAASNNKELKALAQRQLNYAALRTRKKGHNNKTRDTLTTTTTTTTTGTLERVTSKINPNNKRLRAKTANCIDNRINYLLVKSNENSDELGGVALDDDDEVRHDLIYYYGDLKKRRRTANAVSGARRRSGQRQQQLIDEGALRRDLDHNIKDLAERSRRSQLNVKKFNEFQFEFQFSDEDYIEHKEHKVKAKTDSVILRGDAIEHNNDESHNDPISRHYIQLAAQYYEQGFLANLKYLQALRERNELTRKSNENKANSIEEEEGEHEVKISEEGKALRNIYWQKTTKQGSKQTSAAAVVAATSNDDDDINASAVNRAKEIPNAHHQQTNEIATSAKYSDIIVGANTKFAKRNTKAFSSHSTFVPTTTSAIDSISKIAADNNRNAHWNSSSQEDEHNYLNTDSNNNYNNTKLINLLRSIINKRNSFKKETKNFNKTKKQIIEPQQQGEEDEQQQHLQQPQSSDENWSIRVNIKPSALTPITTGATTITTTTTKRQQQHKAKQQQKLNYKNNNSTNNKINNNNNCVKVNNNNNNNTNTNCNQNNRIKLRRHFSMTDFLNANNFRNSSETSSNISVNSKNFISYNNFNSNNNNNNNYNNNNNNINNFNENNLTTLNDKSTHLDEIIDHLKHLDIASRNNHHLYYHNNYQHQKQFHSHSGGSGSGVPKITLTDFSNYNTGNCELRTQEFVEFNQQQQQQQQQLQRTFQFFNNKNNGNNILIIPNELKGFQNEARPP